MDVVVKKFKAVNEPKPSNKNTENNFSYRLGVPYFGRPAYNFGCNIAKLIRNKFNVDISVFYRTFKNWIILSIKVKLVYNLVHQFLCLRDADVSHIGMTSPPLGHQSTEALELKYQ